MKRKKSDCKEGEKNGENLKIADKKVDVEKRKGTHVCGCVFFVSLRHAS